MINVIPYQVKTSRELMMDTHQTYTKQLEAEIQQVPDEYMPALINIIHAFREGVTTLPSAEQSIREGLRDALEGKTYPIETLWDGIDT